MHRRAGRARARDRDGAIRVLAGIAVGAMLAAGSARQIEPAWANRYFAVFLGPLVLARRDPRARLELTAVALVGVAAIWLIHAPIAERQRAHGRRRGHAGDPPGDVVASNPSRCRALALPAQRRALRDAARDGLRRARDRLAQRARADARGQAAARPGAAAPSARPGGRILLVTPIPRPLSRRRGSGPSPRTREWRRALSGDPRLREIEAPARKGRSSTCAARCAAEVFEVR